MLLASAQRSPSHPGGDMKVRATAGISILALALAMPAHATDAAPDPVRRPEAPLVVAQVSVSHPSDAGSKSEGCTVTKTFVGGGFALIIAFLTGGAAIPLSCRSGRDG